VLTFRADHGETDGRARVADGGLGKWRPRGWPALLLGFLLEGAPAVFGYHEVFHALTSLAAGMHFAAVASIVLPTA
jgi:hypothetical protein